MLRRLDIAVMPGALTPTEVVQAWNAGADFVKVFPAGAVGGASYLKALKAPFPDRARADWWRLAQDRRVILFVLGRRRSVLGPDLVDINAIRDGQAAVITARAKQFIEIVREARAS